LPMFNNYESEYIDEPLFYYLVNVNSVSLSALSENINKIHRQMDDYKEILCNVVESNDFKNKKHLLKVIEQKYICVNLEYAKSNENEEKIEYYQRLYDEFVLDNNLYGQEIEKIINRQK